MYENQYFWPHSFNTGNIISQHKRGRTSRTLNFLHLVDEKREGNETSSGLENNDDKLKMNTLMPVASYVVLCQRKYCSVELFLFINWKNFRYVGNCKYWFAEFSFTTEVDKEYIFYSSVFISKIVKSVSIGDFKKQQKAKWL